MSAAVAQLADNLANRPPKWRSRSESERRARYDGVDAVHQESVVRPSAPSFVTLKMIEYIQYTITLCVHRDVFEMRKKLMREQRLFFETEAGGGNHPRGT
mgnify:CR=1 FL=1